MRPTRAWRETPWFSHEERAALALAEAVTRLAAARLDDGAMWPTAFALTKLTAADEKRIGSLVKTAAN